MVEENLSFVRLMKRALSQAHAGDVAVVDVATSTEAEELLSQRHFDALVLDLGSAGEAEDPLADFNRLHRLFPYLPIVVLASTDDYELSLQAMRSGAQDYLVKDKVTGQLLVRSLRYAIERQHMLDTMRRLAMLDEHTGLYNKSGFVTLVQQQVQLSRRTERQFVLLLIDIENYAEITEVFGAAASDLVIAQMAELLRRTFRSSDIIAHLDKSEFGVLAIDVEAENLENLLARLQKNVLSWNLQNVEGANLTLCFGATQFNGNKRYNVEDLIAQARQNKTITHLNP